MVQIGSTLEKGEIETVANAIIRIMEAKAEQKTIRKALDVFYRSAEVKASITGCNLDGRTENHTHHHYNEPEPEVTAGEASPWSGPQQKIEEERSDDDAPAQSSEPA